MRYVLFTVLFLSFFSYAQTDCTSANITVYDSKSSLVSSHTQAYKANTAAILLSQQGGKATVKTPDIVCTTRLSSASSSSVASQPSSLSSVSSAAASSQSSAQTVGTYSIPVTNFGTKPSVATFDDFSTYTLGNAGATGSNVGTITLSYNPGAQTIASDSFVGTKSLQHNYAVNDFPKDYITLSGKQRFFFSAYIKFSGNASGASVWKLGRIGSGQVYFGYPRAGESYGADPMPSVLMGEIWTLNNMVEYAGSNTAGHDAESAYVKDKWMFYTFEFNAGTPGQKDAYTRVHIDGKPVAIWNNHYYRTTSSVSELPQWFLTPINGIDGSPALLVNMDGVYWDESNARVIFTDNAAFNQSTKFNIQPITSYSDTNVAGKTYTPSFLSGATVHRHVWDKDGVYFYAGSITL